MERQEQEQEANKKISCDVRSTYPIPDDAIEEILKASSVETLARFRCVLTQYASMIRSREFMKSHLIKSSTRPLKSLIFTFMEMMEHLENQFVFSASQPQNQGESSSSATYHMSCQYQLHTTSSASVHGLFCHGGPPKMEIYNPSTRKSITLPNIYYEMDYIYLGYDPIDGDYKVLCMIKAEGLLILNVGKDTFWRKIENFPPHDHCSTYSPDLTLNGVLYYVVHHHLTDGILLPPGPLIRSIMSFDVRSEKFNLMINLPELPDNVMHPILTTYEGRLAFFCNIIHGDSTIILWVQEDAVKHEWSKHLYVPAPLHGHTYDVFTAFCFTDGGEFVLAPLMFRSEEPFYVVYYDTKKNAVRRFAIEGIFTELDKETLHLTQSIFPGQINNPMFL